ncbi:MAG TPA: DUF2127 domain-containing protein [Gemmatimonadales bacterium]|nr:DUF2127 domain-containing protein [Gemmatimonadales bacterium]
MPSKIHIAFEIGVILKGLNGLMELVGGTLLLVFPLSAIRQFIVDLSHRPDFAQKLSTHDERFAAIYLLSHGIIKGVLVYGLLKEQMWAFPWAIAIFAAFGVYQIIHYFVQPSIWMIVLTVLDVFVILLTIAEWRRLKHARG